MRTAILRCQRACLTNCVMIKDTPDDDDGILRGFYTRAWGNCLYCKGAKCAAASFIVDDDEPGGMDGHTLPGNAYVCKGCTAECEALTSSEEPPSRCYIDGSKANWVRM